MPTPQNYPRIDNASSLLNGCLDDEQLARHVSKISSEEMSAYIRTAILKAEQKSGREILNIPEDATHDRLQEIYDNAGKELFEYFRRYFGDPAATACELIEAWT